MRHQPWPFNLWLGAAAVLALALIAACEATPPAEPTAAPPPATAAPTALVPTSQPTPVPPTPAPPTPVPATPAPSATPGSSAEEQIVAAVRADLAKRLAIPLEEVVVSSVEAADWPNTGLGCPEPRKMYLQVITPGFRIWLEAQGRRYEYHTDRGLSRVLCRP